MSKPVLLTWSGTGADMWTGYPADLARRMEDLWYFQPVNYGPNGIPAVFPMGPSWLQGVEEGVRLVFQHESDPQPPPFYGVCGYSQGAMPAAQLLWEFRQGRLKQFEHKLQAGATFGNPFREAGHDGAGAGIGDQLIVGTPDWWVDEAEPADIYTSVPVGAGLPDQVAADMRAIFKLVQLRNIGDVFGAGSLLPTVMGILQSPLQQFPAVVEAIIKGLMFVGAKPATAPHIEYHIRQRAGTGMTYYEHAVAHMRARGAVLQAA
ncbi:endolysin [Mycobacterium phage MacnCheese]|uniref:Lysin B n=1 Tax=Mycobacterium phage MacnCheese TaxID=2927982 RepID=I6X3B0_9CAUD|nr:endolysin [Mycobacterium phage MacnCheese]AFN37727.1 lysin B [Mycobacterium phage MacnCheese]